MFFVLFIVGFRGDVKDIMGRDIRRDPNVCGELVTDSGESMFHRSVFLWAKIE